MTSAARIKREFIKQKDGYLFILPQMALFLVFTVFPVFSGLRLSLFSVSFVRQTYVGLRNYAELLADPIFIRAIFNNLQFALIVVVLANVIGLFISTAVFDKSTKYMSFVRGAFYLPVMITMVAYSITWVWMLNPAMGLINYLVGVFGLPSINFMGDETVALYILIFIMLLWNLGQAVILYVAAMLGIPQSVFEAATIDGASRFQVIRYIILPLVRQTTMYFTILCLIGIINVFAVIQLITAGGPNYSTMTMMYYCYNEAFVMNNMGKASAVGMIMFFIVASLSILALTQLRSRKDA
jgi:multiple sugar transport system permease protein